VNLLLHKILVSILLSKYIQLITFPIFMHRASVCTFLSRILTNPFFHRTYRTFINKNSSKTVSRFCTPFITSYIYNALSYKWWSIVAFYKLCLLIGNFLIITLYLHKCIDRNMSFTC